MACSVDQDYGWSSTLPWESYSYSLRTLTKRDHHEEKQDDELIDLRKGNEPTLTARILINKGFPT